MKKLKALLLGFAISLTFAMVPAYAIPITGSIDAENNGGLTATGPWDNKWPEAHLSWQVFELESLGVWVYQYLFMVPRKEITYSIIEVGDDFTAADVLFGTSSGWQLGTWTNPGTTESIYGLKFISDGFIELIQIVTDIAPQWGSFYAKDGKQGGNDVYAYNDNYGDSSGDGIYGAAPDGFVLVPGGDSNQSVPEPGSLALMGLGLLMAGSIALKKGQKKPL